VSFISRNRSVCVCVCLERAPTAHPLSACTHSLSLRAPTLSLCVHPLSLRVYLMFRSPPPRPPPLHLCYTAVLSARPGNIWKSKTDESKFLLADWQVQYGIHYTHCTDYTHARLAAGTVQHTLYTLYTLYSYTADWQAVRMGPIGFDFFTMFCTTGELNG
jgi:hypothetical protein